MSRISGLVIDHIKKDGHCLEQGVSHGKEKRWRGEKKSEMSPFRLADCSPRRAARDEWPAGCHPDRVTLTGLGLGMAAWGKL